MSEFRLIDSKTLPLTREVAQQFKDMEASPTERPLDLKRVKHLREKAEAGHLVTFHWSVATIGDKKVRMNGQHSSSMLCELNGEFPDGLIVHLDDYEVSDEHGQALLFRQFDDRKSGRTASDVSGAYQGLYAAVVDVPRVPAKLAVEGVSWFRRVVEGSPAPRGDDRYALFGEEGLHGFVNFVGELIGRKQGEMRKETICAAIYATYNANEAEARTFWYHVSRGGVDFEPEHPTTVLSEWLNEVTDPKSKQKAKAAHFYQACVYAWNAYRENKPLKSMRVNFDRLKDWVEPAV